MGVDHDDISELAAVGDEIVGQLIRGLVDLPVAEDALGILGALGLYHAVPVGVLLRIGGEDVVDSYRETESEIQALSNAAHGGRGTGARPGTDSPPRNSLKCRSTVGSGSTGFGAIVGVN